MKEKEEKGGGVKTRRRGRTVGAVTCCLRRRGRGMGGRLPPRAVVPRETVIVGQSREGRLFGNGGSVRVQEVGDVAALALAEAHGHGAGGTAMVLLPFPLACRSRNNLIFSMDSAEEQRVRRRAIADISNPRFAAVVILLVTE